MAYLGRKGAPAPINASDIPDNSITSAKILADAVGSSDLAPDIVLTGGSVSVPSVTTANLPGTGGGTYAAQTATNAMLVYNSTLGMLQQRAAGIWSGITTAPVITSFEYSDGASATAEKTVATVISCTTQTSTTVLVPGVTSAIIVGQVVSGVGVPLGATVVSIVTDTSFVLSSAATASATINLTFGGVVTISGTNFDSILAGGSANAAVTFDGTTATSISVNSLKSIITCTPPAHAAGTITMLITNASGLSASTNFIYDEEAIFTTAAGSLGGFVEGTTFSDNNAASPRIQATDGEGSPTALTTGFQRVTSASDDTVITTTIGDLTLQTSGYLTGTLVAAANATTYPFYATAKDSQNQRTAPRLFNIISYDTTASGGVITTYTGYKVHTFLTTATFNPNMTLSCDILIIAGGGAGGDDYNGGGGGAGGVIWRTGVSLTGGVTYTATRGAGGGNGASGSNSTFSGTGLTTITATGGGRGGGASAVAGGGSGGGGMSWSGAVAGGSATGAAEEQGFAGGDGVSSGENYDHYGGGGGGAGAVGSAGNSSTNKAGPGGVGASTLINQSSVTTYASDTTALLLSAEVGTDSSNVATTSSSSGTLYIAGGGGGSGGWSNAVAGGTGANVGGAGGDGGGGNGGDIVGHINPVAGFANTGSGGGGWGRHTTGSAGIGGSGVIIIRYAV